MDKQKIKNNFMKTKLFTKVFVSGLALIAAGCNGSSNSSSGGGAITHCPDQITAGASMGIMSIPADADSGYKNYFCKYTELVAPNGKSIAFYAQNLVTNEQMVRAREILNFYLTDVPDSTYGTNKTSVFNKMADNNATLAMPNGADGDAPFPPVDGQSLYQEENIVEGSAAYLINNPRDAAFEEILHLMHDTGIGVDGVNSSPGVLPAYQKKIRAAMENAIVPGVLNQGQGAQRGLWPNGSDFIGWLKELEQENSLTQEYLASVIDTYYGLAGKSTYGGTNDLYKPQTREQIKTIDPMGWALVGGNNSREYFSQYVTYNARIDSNFSGTFSLVFDANTQYTYKSQYLLDATLTGTKPTGLQGNAQNNRLTGNGAANIINAGAGNDFLIGGQGNDTLDGGAGSDMAEYSGMQSEYSVTYVDAKVIVTDNIASRDGVDTLMNVETLRFKDQTMDLTAQR